MCISDISLHLRRKEAFTFFSLFSKENIRKAGQTSCLLRKQRTRVWGARRSVKKERSEGKIFVFQHELCEASQNLHYKYSILYKCISLFFCHSLLLTMRLQSHNSSPFCHAVFLLWLSMFRIKDLAYMVDPARSKVKNCYVSGILIKAQRILGQVPRRSEFHS